ncbi:hypothetical protein Patl1_11488 [Pistacia atlantica]|uniref:Uncharacterized protein n=1 Tax=Pistacia atlantica TaxID=434234 RepID=A0ACC1A6C3_9ROSI|nr:hypothetical protein Patl1_11488 [Pistacia atlantica]
MLVFVLKTVAVFRVERLLEENATNVAYKRQFVAPVSDNNLFMRMLWQPVIRNKKHTLRVYIVTLYLGGADSVVSLSAKEFPELGQKTEDCRDIRWIDYFGGRKLDYRKKPIPKHSLSLIWKIMELRKIALIFNPYGGSMDEIPEAETTFPHKAGILFKIQYSVSWDSPDIELEKNHNTSQINRLYSCMTPFVSENPMRAYLNYRDLDIGIDHNDKNRYNEGQV